MPEAFPLRIKQVNLANFRSYKQLNLEIKGQLVFFTGPNGIGKTSILEAVSMASLLKSFRNAKDKSMIQWDDSLYAIDVVFENQQGEQSLHIGYGKHPMSDGPAMARRLSINKEKVERIADFIGKFQTVVFSPDDLEIIDTTPAERRRFIDMLLSTLYPAYLEALQEYRKILRMRSELLKKSGDRPLDLNYMTSIDKQLSAHGSLIQERRRIFLGEFQEPFDRYIARISNEKDSWIIAYKPSVVGGGEAETYQEALAASLPNDQRLRQNTVGVHRDRIVFQPRGRENLDLQEIASQGQKRTVALALRMAQFSYTQKLTHETPILLIDDVLNELDISRRTSFIQFLDDIGQALVTTTDLAGMEEYIAKKKKETSVEAFELYADGDEIKLRSLEI